MRRNIVPTALALVLAALVPGILATAQELHKSYAIPAGGHVVINNVSGDLKVTVYNGDSIVVDAYPVGRDSNLVRVDDLSAGDRVELHVRYPESCNCDASVNFSVRVPANVSFNFDRIGSVSGSVDIAGVRGNIHAASVSGSVVVKDVAGMVNASSVSGSVEAEMTRIEGTGDMKFSSVSGSVNVKAPGNANVDIEMSTISGGLDTDFPIEIHQPEYGPGRSARGIVGSGGSRLRLSSVSGRVSLTRS
ncbi:MAG TPA: DUF4097 family beta strand repeat-containing protein [Acidobacteriota bacterium]|nr:DUF4097 family beta strand repeat-containing protein [Acidobacteriota bacterium]